MGENTSPSTSRSYVTSYNNLELTQLLNAKSPLTGLKVKIIPRFERTANQNNQEVAEDVLCHADFDLGGLDDDQLVIQTVPLIYILYVFPSSQNQVADSVRTARLESSNRHRRKDRSLLDFCCRYAGLMDARQAGLVLPRGPCCPGEPLVCDLI
jgi:hypothetical protein